MLLRYPNCSHCGLSYPSDNIIKGEEAVIKATTDAKDMFLNMYIHDSITKYVFHILRKINQVVIKKYNFLSEYPNLPKRMSNDVTRELTTRLKRALSIRYRQDSKLQGSGRGRRGKQVYTEKENMCRTHRNMIIGYLR